jgi:selenide,water dikinase
VGLDTSDDAAVYKINDDLALIHTVDFFTPVVDDPYTFGQIAACNALSDIYAMGGNPILALNVVAFPEELVENILPDVLRGGADKVIEAGAVVGGGHSIKSPEPIYGLSVIGEISTDKIMTNAGAKPEDVLILTKPLGIGVATTALKADMLSKETERQAVEVMSTLNREASQAAVQTGVNAITDITGFGLLGHAFEMAEASKVTLRLKAGLLPILSGVEELAAMGILPAGLYHNKKYLKGKVYISSEVPEALTDLAFDPQTSGGLLISVSEDRASVLLKLLKESGVKDATVIGKVVEPQDYRIILE